MCAYRIVKIALLGSAAVGKSSLVRMLAKEGIEPIYISTIGVDIKFIYIHERNIKIVMWDLAGLSRFQDVIKNFVESCDIILFCYSANNQNSLNEMTELYEKYKYLEKECVIIATKTDKAINNDYETMGRNYSQKIKADFFLTSIYGNIGRNKVLNRLAYNIPEPLEVEMCKPCKSRESCFDCKIS